MSAPDSTTTRRRRSRIQAASCTARSRPPPRSVPSTSAGLCSGRGSSHPCMAHGQVHARPRTPTGRYHAACPGARGPRRSAAPTRNSAPGPPPSQSHSQQLSRQVGRNPRRERALHASGGREGHPLAPTPTTTDGRLDDQFDEAGHPAIMARSGTEKDGWPDAYLVGTSCRDTQDVEVEVTGVACNWEERLAAQQELYP